MPNPRFSWEQTVERFWTYVSPEPTSGCWLWAGGATAAGYPVFAGGERIQSGNRRRQVGAHRFSYQLKFGPIGKGLQLDHLCRTPLCINPDHLEPVTPRENTMRGVGPSARNAVATHCIHGHAFTEKNTWRNPRTRARHCRECMRARTRSWKARNREHVSAYNARYHAEVRKPQSIISLEKTEAEFERWAPKEAVET